MRTCIPAASVEDGQALPLVALLIALGSGAILLLAGLGQAANTQARAQAAADAAALAAAIDGPEAARLLASANGAALTAIEVAPQGARVSVSLGGRSAAAQAETVATGHQGLDPALVAAIAAASALLGQPIPVVSGFRSAVEQQSLWARRDSNPYPVAAPGTSMHERGLAIDVERGFVARLQAVADVVGLCQPLPGTDPVHFELCRMTATR